MVAHTFNQSTQEMQAGGSGFKASLGYTRPSLKIIEEEERGGKMAQWLRPVRGPEVSSQNPQGASQSHL